MTTDERLTKLEKQLARGRRLNRCLLAALCLCLAAWALVAALQPKTASAQPGAAGANVVRASQFILEDENGNIRAELSMIAGGPRLALFDESGNGLAVLSATYNDPRLTFYDDNGATSSALSRSSLSLFTQDASVLLQASADGVVGLVLSESGPEPTSSSPDPVENVLERLAQINPVTRAALVWTADGPSLILADENGAPRAGLTVGENGAALDLVDENGTFRARIGAGTTTLPDGTKTVHPESTLMLFGPDGKATWQAP